MTSQVVTFEPSPATGGQARRFVAEFLDACGRTHLVDDAKQCVTELASNALLHTRSPYDVAIRTAGDGVRIDVIDDRPAEIPTQVPLSGSAMDLTDESTTGRGLGIVAGSLSELLTVIPGRRVGSAAAPSEELLRFRAWIEQEVSAQLGGAAPSPCLLPD